MTRTDELRDRSIRELQGLLDSKERGRTIIPALSGDAEGNTEVSGSEAFMWVRPYHNDHSRLKAYNGGLVRNVAGIPLEVEIMSHPGSNPTARIIGRSYYGAPEWDDAQQGVSGTPVYVAKHALTHEARPGSGDDVVNIYTRALTELRADQQATPGLTVQVRAGTWYYGTALKLFAGGNSPAFAAPAAGYRWDLLYLANTNILTIKTGTAAGTLALAARPDPNADTLPVAYILLQSTTTTITDDLIYDARQLADQVLSSSLASHAHSGGPHTGLVIGTEVDDYSADVATMQVVTDPYPAGVESLATTYQGELARLRYLLVQITGEANWYVDPDLSIAAIGPLISNLADATFVTTEEIATFPNEKVLGPEIIIRGPATSKPAVGIEGRIYIESDGPNYIVWRDCSAGPLTGYTYKKRLKFDTATISIVTNQVDFPVCVHINTLSWPTAGERTSFFGGHNVAGKRVQFFDGNGKNLDYEVEYYDSGTPEAVYWVRVPQVDGDSNADYIWVAYGSDPSGVDQDNPTEVWNTNFRTVYHMKDTAAYFQNVAGIDDGGGGHLGFSRVLTIPASSATATIVVRDNLNHHNEALTETQTLRYAYSGAADLTIWLVSDPHVGVDAAAGDDLIHDIDDIDVNFPATTHVLACGDLTDHGSTSEYDDYIAARAHSSIGAGSWHELPGNHDNLTTGDPSNFIAKLGYAGAYYSFDIDNLHFIMLGALDGSYQGGWNNTLLTWLEAELSGNQDKNIIVCTHQGVYNTVVGMTNSSYYLDKVAEINVLLQKYSVDMWFCGHYHIVAPAADWVSKRKLIYDSTPNGKAATKIAYENPAQVIDGVGPSQHFNGSSSFVRCPSTDIMAVPGSDDMMVELWVKPHTQPAAGNYRQLLAFVTSPSGTAGWLTILRYYNNAGTYQLLGSIEGAGFTWATNNYTLSNNVWYHVAMANTGGVVTVFVNGSPLASTGTTGTPIDWTTSSTGLTIGKSRHPESNQYYFWDGVEDEVRILEAAFSADWLALEYYSMLKTNFNGDSWLSWDAAEGITSSWIEIARSEAGTRLAQLAEKAHDSLTGLLDDDHTQYVKDSEYSAKGRILVGTGAGTFTALAVGADDEVLTADAAQASGTKWAAAAGSGGGMMPFWEFRGDIAALGAGAGTPIRMPYAGTIEAVLLLVETQGTAGATTVDINNGGVTIYTTQANRPSVAFDDGDDYDVTIPDVTAFAQYDEFEVDYDAKATDAEDAWVIIICQMSPGGITTTVEVQEDDVKVADAGTVNFEGGGGKVTDEGGGKITVDITPGAGGGAPTDYPYAGFGASGDLTAEVNLYDFYGKNLIKNSPGQIVTDGAEPQWWDDVANATITDEDLAGEAVAEKHKRAFKVVTIADNVYGYQTLTFADEDLLDAGETMVSLSTWVYCVAAAKASIGIYGTNLGLQESSQAGAGAWTLLKVEGITLNATDTSIAVRFIVDTGTAYFTMPMLNVGPRAFPWHPRSKSYQEVAHNYALSNIPHNETLAWTELDLTALTHNLAVRAAMAYLLQQTAANMCQIYIRPGYDEVSASDVRSMLIRKDDVTDIAGKFDIDLDDRQVFDYYTINNDGTQFSMLQMYIQGYWRWE